MRRLILLAFLLSGCAAGRITGAGDIQCVAVGKSRCELCEAPAPTDHKARPICRSIQGGNLGTGAVEVLDSLAAVVAAYFGGGAL